MTTVNLDRIVTRAIEIQQIPAPTFNEFERSTYLHDQFASAGLKDVSIDELGNVYGRSQRSEGPHLIVSAHLDTVFPANTPLDIQRQGSRLIGPGIGDNAIALAMMIEVADTFAMQDRMKGSVWFVGNVREEGLGNLEGMHRVVDRFEGHVKAYLVLEGMGIGHIYHRGLQVQRYRISVETPGGHAWIHAGQASAIHTLLQIGSEITRMPRPAAGQSSVNVGTIQGGTSINTISSHAQLDLDLRSEVSESLEQLDVQLKQILARYQSEDVKVTKQHIGSRPGGEIPADHKLVRLACDALKAADVAECCLGIASTDANVPLSKGFPSVCVGLTQGGDAHTTHEYIDLETIPNGYIMLMHLLEGALENAD